MRALASDGRVAILQLLQSRTLNVSAIADALGTTMSATSEHIKVLSDAGLITTEMTPGTRGLQKACGRAVDGVLVSLPEPEPLSRRVIEVSMPVGGFASFNVQPTCGLLSGSGPIGLFDDVRSFYEPDRSDAQLPCSFSSTPHRLTSQKASVLTAMGPADSSSSRHRQTPRHLECYLTVSIVQLPSSLTAAHCGSASALVSRLEERGLCAGST